MGRALIIVSKDADREQAAEWARKSPAGTRITFQRSKRTLPQNDKLWACLTDVSAQVDWYGQKLAPADWKDVFTASLRKARVVPGIDPGSFVLLGLHTSDMDKEELSSLIDLIICFGTERGVVFHDMTASEAA